MEYFKFYSLNAITLLCRNRLTCLKIYTLSSSFSIFKLIRYDSLVQNNHFVTKISIYTHYLQSDDYFSIRLKLYTIFDMQTHLMFAVINNNRDIVLNQIKPKVCG